MHSSSKRVLTLPPLGAVPQTGAAVLAQHPTPVIRPVAPRMTEERLLELEREAYANGFASGERAGRETGMEAARELVAAIDRVREELTTVREALLVEAQREVAHLAVAVAEAMVGYEVEAGHPVVKAGIAAAAEHFAPSTPLSIRIHPRDQAMLAAEKPSLATKLANEFELVTDEAMTPGGVVVEGGGKVIDAHLVTRFSHLVQDLLEQLG